MRTVIVVVLVACFAALASLLVHFVAANPRAHHRHHNYFHHQQQQQHQHHRQAKHPKHGDNGHHRDASLENSAEWLVHHKDGVDAAAELRVSELHRKFSVTGSGVLIAQLDSGVNFPSFSQSQKSQIAECQSFAAGNVAASSSSSSSSCFDSIIGHGTFGASLILGGCSASASSSRDGIAPGAGLVVAKVFSHTQSSGVMTYTSWIVDALNFVLARHSALRMQGKRGIELLTLSVGSSDLLDAPFNAKLDEITAAGITVVAASGNSDEHEGELRFGTILNPADRMDVIAVGGVKTRQRSGVDSIWHLANASSAGPTLREFAASNDAREKMSMMMQPMGRFKPDIVTVSENLIGRVATGGCGIRSGTSLAAPIVAGALALAFELLHRGGVAPNPGIARTLISGGVSNKDNSSSPYSLFGEGVLDVEQMLLEAQRMVESRKDGAGDDSGGDARLRFFPPKIDLRTSLDRYQPVVYDAHSFFVNITVWKHSAAEERYSFAVGDPCVEVYGSSPFTSASSSSSSNNSRTGSSSATIAVQQFGWIAVRVQRDCETAKNSSVMFSSTVDGQSRGIFELLLPKKTIADSNITKQTKRVLWCTHHQRFWPAHPAAADNNGFFDRGGGAQRGNHLHFFHRHSDSFETSNDDPRISGATSSLLHHLLRHSNGSFVVDVSSIALDAVSDLCSYDAIILFDIEAPISESEQRLLQKCSASGKNFSLVVVAEWGGTKEMVRKLSVANPDRNGAAEHFSVGGCNARSLNKRVLLPLFDVELSNRVFSQLTAEDSGGTQASATSSRAAAPLEAFPSICRIPDTATTWFRTAAPADALFYEIGLVKGADEKSEAHVGIVRSSPTGDRPAAALLFQASEIPIELRVERSHENNNSSATRLALLADSGSCTREKLLEMVRYALFLDVSDRQLSDGGDRWIADGWIPGERFIVPEFLAATRYADENDDGAQFDGENSSMTSLKEQIEEALRDLV